jgi:hypothetical protein
LLAASRDPWSAAATITSILRHARKPDAWYAIRTTKGPWGIVYRVSFYRQGKNVAKLFRARDYDSARAALKAAPAWRDSVTRKLGPETKQEFCQRARPDNTSGCPGAYLKRQVVRRRDWSGEYAFWQAQTPQGVRPFRSRSFSVDRFGFDDAYELAVRGAGRVRRRSRELHRRGADTGAVSVCQRKVRLMTSLGYLSALSMVPTFNVLTWYLP